MHELEVHELDHPHGALLYGGSGFGVIRIGAATLHCIALTGSYAMS